MRIAYMLACTTVAAAVLSGCPQNPGTGPAMDTSAPTPAPAATVAPEPAMNQADLCEVHFWRHDDVSEKCTPGQKVIYLPDRWGNEQLPILFAAVNCDLRYSVALTNGAVTCIYSPITPAAPPPQPPTQEAPSKP